MTSIKKAAFTGCERHGRFDYFCHACLVDTVVRLCDLLDDLTDKEETLPFRIAFRHPDETWTYTEGEQVPMVDADPSVIDKEET